MTKENGSSNYSLPEMVRLLDIVRAELPLGKNDWERVAVQFNLTKSDKWAERGVNSLRRKFKQLYGTKKPTGNPNMPVHILSAKETKVLIDHKAGVVDLEDQADEDESYTFVDQDEANVASALIEVSSTLSADDPAEGRSLSLEYWSPVMNNTCVARIPTNLASYNSTQPLPMPSSLGTCAEEVRDPAHPLELREPASRSLVASSASATPQFALTSRTQTAADARELARYPGLVDHSDRLGGGSLEALRIPSKRANEGVAESEASFTKQKRIRAERAVASMHKKLDEHEGTAMRATGDIMHMMLVMKADGERKAELRREEEAERRRYEQADRELRRREDREEREERRRLERYEAEERRRAEKEEAEERRRSDKEDARVRMQELMVLVGTISKN